MICIMYKCVGLQLYFCEKFGFRRCQNMWVWYSRVTVPGHRNWQIKTAVCHLASFLHCTWARGKQRGFSPGAIKNRAMSR